MRNLNTAIIIVISVVFSMHVNAYTLDYIENGSTIKWDQEEIIVYLDPSLEIFGDDAYAIIEESFLTWSDFIDDEITLHFINEECDFITQNCVKYTQLNKHCSTATQDTTGCTFGSIYLATGRMCNQNINFYPSLEAGDLKHVAMHEIGHFFGLNHSLNTNAVMYQYVNGRTELHQDDINGISSLYGDEILPSIANDKVDYGFAGCDCSMNPFTGHVLGSLFSLIGLFF